MAYSKLYWGHVKTFKKEDKALAERGFTNKLEHYSLNTGGALNKKQNKNSSRKKIMCDSYTDVLVTRLYSKARGPQ